MRASVNLASLARAIKYSCSEKSNPPFSSIKIEAINDKVVVTTCNTSSELTITIDAVNVEAGEVYTGYAGLLGVIKTCQSDTVAIETVDRPIPKELQEFAGKSTEPTLLNITCGRSKFKLPCDEVVFPERYYEADEDYTLSSETFSRITEVAFVAKASGEVSYRAVDINGGVVSATTLEVFMLLEVPELPSSLVATIPVEPLLVASEFVDGNVSLTQSQDRSQLRLSGDGWSLLTATPVHAWPNTDGLTKPAITGSLTCSHMDLLQAVKVADAVPNSCLIIGNDPDTGMLRIQTEGNSNASASTVFNGSVTVGKPEFKLSSTLLQMILKGTGGFDLTMSTVTNPSIARIEVGDYLIFMTLFR